MTNLIKNSEISKAKTEKRVPTIKMYNQKVEERRKLYFESEQAKKQGNWDLYFELKSAKAFLENDFFEKLPRVNVSYMIGTRQYYDVVIKIKNSYFLYGRKMTYSKGGYPTFA